MSNKAEPKSDKKILENPFLGSLVVPIAIVLVGALVVWGVTRMLSVDRDHRDLVREIESKTFGNKWVAAYELSKLLATDTIPEQDIDWTVDKLGAIFKAGTDLKTKNFLIVALGSMKKVEAIPILLEALNEEDSKIKFNALVALGNMPQLGNTDFDKIGIMLDSEDQALKHAAILTLSTHRAQDYQSEIEKALGSPSRDVRYAAATGLINFKSERAIPYLRQLLLLEYPEKVEKKGEYTYGNVVNLKLNVINALRLNQWSALNETLLQLSQDDSDAKVLLKAKEVLNLLKN